MPTYPEDLPTRIRRLELLVERLFTAAQLKEPFTKLVARGMVVGQDAPGRRWVFNPDSAPSGSAEIWGVPEGVDESNAVRLIADTDSEYPDEVLFHLVSGADSAGDSELRMASGEVFMRIRDDSGDDDGGYAFWGRDEARFGYRSSNSENYFRFGRNVCRHFGAWDDYASLSSDAGLLWGSITIGGSSTSASIGYPSFMDSNMGPIVSLRNGNAVSMAWCITASDKSGYTVAWQTATSVALYQCAFRH